MRIQKIRPMFPISAIFLTVLAGGILVAGCDNSQTPGAMTAQGNTVVTSLGSRPTWDVEDMVKLADAVVIGTFTQDLGDKQKPGSGAPYIYYHYKEYKLTVEEAHYPKADLWDSRRPNRAAK